MPTLIQIPMGGGLDQSADARALPVTAATTLQNVSFEKDGSYRKRYGYTALATGVTSVKRLAAYKDQLLAIDGANVWSYRPSGTSAAWKQGDAVCPTRITWDPVLQYGAAIQQMDIGYGSGFWVYAFAIDLTGAGSTQVYVTVVDATSGTPVFDTHMLTSSGATIGSNPRVVITGGTSNTAIVTWQAAGGIDVSAASLNLLSPTAWTLNNIVLTVAAGTQYAVCAQFAQAGLFFVCESGSANNQIAVTTMSNTFTGAATANLAEVNTGFAAFACKQGGIDIGGIVVQSVWIAYSRAASTNVLVRAVNQGTRANNVAVLTLLTALSGTLVSLGIEIISDSRAVTVVGGATNVGYYRQHSNLGAAVGPQRTLLSYTPIAKPFLQGGKVYLPVLFIDADALQYSCFLLDLVVSDTTTTNLAPRPVGTIMPRTCALLGNMGSSVQPATNQWAWLTPGSPAQLGRVNSVRVDVDFASRKNWLTATLGDHLYVASGMPQVYDGRSLTEVGFLFYHAQTALSLARVPATGNLAAGLANTHTYKYAAVYEQVDATGAIHRATCSTPQPIATIVADDACDVTFRHLHLTARQDSSLLPQLTVQLYRTKVDASNLYRLGTSNTAIGLYNSPVTLTSTYRDGLADTTLGGYPLVYTTGGILNNVCPPAAVGDPVAHRSRIWMIAGDRRTVWFSKPFLLGEAPGFNESLTFSVDDTGAVLTALGSLDDKLVCFTANAIYVVVGDGPNDTGAGSDLSTPQRIASDVGCIDPRSVVSAPLGVFFQSSRGIHLLTRGLEVQHIGAPIVDTMASFPVCTSAVLVPARSQLRFTLMALDQDEADARIATFDDRRGRWTIQKLTLDDTDGPSLATFHPSYGHVIYEDLYDNVLYEDATTYEDGSSGFAPMVYESPWISPAGLQGQFQIIEVLVLGERLSAHGMTVEVAIDDGSYEALTFTEANITTIGTSEQVRVIPTHRSAQRFRVRLADTAPASVGTGQGCALYGVTVAVEPLNGPTRNLSSTAKK